MTALWAKAAAERFWLGAGSPVADFPRDLRRAAAFALPLAVVDLPRLGISAIDSWLLRRGITLRIGEEDRVLRACLVAYGGAGMVFLDGGDPDDERRFSLAHEIAHFLLDYVIPRERVVARLAPDLVEVLDGGRAPTSVERADALLAGVNLGLTLHLMERLPSGLPYHAVISAAERRADALALELLAPNEAVRARLHGGAATTEVESLLRAIFGLPEPVARRCALEIAPEDSRRQSVVGSLLRDLATGGLD